MQTVGNLIDELTIVNIRIWMAEDIKRNVDSSASDIVRATNITNVANQKRNDIIQEIDEKINHLVMTQIPQKLYSQGSTKMYGK